MKICVCPPILLGQVRQALSCLPAAVPCFSRLLAIADDHIWKVREAGYFSSAHMDLIESPFVTMGGTGTFGLHQQSTLSC